MSLIDKSVVLARKVCLDFKEELSKSLSVNDAFNITSPWCNLD